MDYKNSKIYKLVCKDLNITNFYVGSTAQPLCKRMVYHRQKVSENPNRKVYKFINEHGGFQNWSIVLIENFPCNNKEEQLKREQYWKDLLKPTLNSIDAYVSEGRYKDKTRANAKKWTLSHPEKRKEICKRYHENNRDKVLEGKKTFYEKNKTIILVKNKKYTEKLRKTRLICRCGGNTSLAHKSRHNKSDMHQAWQKIIGDKEEKLAKWTKEIDQLNKDFIKLNEAYYKI